MSKITDESECRELLLVVLDLISYNLWRNGVREDLVDEVMKNVERLIEDEDEYNDD